MVGAEIEEWVPRTEEGGDEIPHYTHPDLFTVKMFHGGIIRNNKYVGGKVSYYDNVDKDKMSLVEVDSMVRGVDPAYVGRRMNYWYRIGNEDDALTGLATDFDAVTMCCCVPEIRLVIIYLDHLDLHDRYQSDEDGVEMFEPEPSTWGYSQVGSSGVVIEELPDSPRKKSSVKIEELPDSPPKAPKGDPKLGRRYKVCASRPKARAVGVTIREFEEDLPTQASKAPVTDCRGKGKEKVLAEDEIKGYATETEEDLVDIDVLQAKQYQENLNMEGEFESSEEDVSEDSDYEPARGDDDYAHYGEDEEWVGDMEEEDNETCTSREAEMKRKDPVTRGTSGVNDEVEWEAFEDNEAMIGAVDSDEEAIGDEANSDDERQGARFPEFNPKTDMANPKFCMGMKFATAKILRAAIRERAIQNGWEAMFVKSDRLRVRVICKAENCPFELFASKMQHEDTLQIKTYYPTHNCARVMENSCVKTPYLTEKFKEQIKLNPDWSTESLAQTMSASAKAKVSVQQAYRTKKAALSQLERSHAEQYARIIDYAAELKRVDANTTVDIKCSFNNPGNDPIFRRMYVCLGALKMGFRSGCRPIIGLDGCHLKSPYGGQLLSAVGLDANNTTWVVAYAMVEMESKDSWVWFLELLSKDLSIGSEGAGWTFISDKQKGLLPAFEDVMPSADHRFCVRHLWTNFNKKFPGKALKDQLWAIAKSTTMAYFTKEMVIMNQIDPGAWDWLNDPQRPARHWTRSHFNTVLKCDILLNNLCESFNAFILPARSKPVISMFEDMRVKLMKRIHMRRDKMAKVQDPICPKPREILEKNKVKAATDCIPYGSGSPQIEVESIGGAKYVVDLQRRTCACRRWNLSGIPCKHVVSAIHFMREKPEDYVEPCYHTKTYMEIYSNTIKPVNGMDLWATGMDLWATTDAAIILPPQYNRQPGRPKTKRIKDQSEKATEGPKLGRVQKSLRCSSCGNLGHNVKTCHRHLPPKEKVSKKRKLNSGEGTSSQSKAKGTKIPPLSKNELRQKVKLRAENLKKKRDEKKAASRAASKATTKSTTTRATSATSQAPSKGKASAPTRSSQRIRAAAKEGEK